jgi:hypothetical protein
MHHAMGVCFDESINHFREQAHRFVDGELTLAGEAFSE